MKPRSLEAEKRTGASDPHIADYVGRRAGRRETVDIGRKNSIGAGADDVRWGVDGVETLVGGRDRIDAVLRCRASDVGETVCGSESNRLIDDERRTFGAGFDTHSTFPDPGASTTEKADESPSPGIHQSEPYLSTVPLQDCPP